jgi:hypothetical protein
VSDVHDTFDYGYDLSIPEEGPLITPPRPATLLPRCQVNPA